MARPAPVYFLYYDGSTVAIYTQAFRVLAYMRNLQREGVCPDKSLFRVIRVGLVPGSQFKLSYKEVTSSLVKFLW